MEFKLSATKYATDMVHRWKVQDISGVLMCMLGADDIDCIQYHPFPKGR